METCFVMQVFDGGAYDRRYDETFAPAIQKGGTTPVRADKILGSKPIIDKIEGALRDATIAFAEISEDNPNVFIELGYALDLRIPLVMVCDRAKRKALPFDITHRPVIFYKTESQGDFEQLSRDIQVAVSAALHEARDTKRARAESAGSSPSNRVTDHLKERILLEILEGEIGDPNGLPAYRIKTALASEGTSQRLSSLAILALTHDKLIETKTCKDFDNDEYLAYHLTQGGREHLLSQYAEIKRREEEKQSPQLSFKATPATGYDVDLEDDVPF